MKSKNNKNYQNQDPEVRFWKSKNPMVGVAFPKNYSLFKLLFWSNATRPSLEPKLIILVHKYIC